MVELQVSRFLALGGGRPPGQRSPGAGECECEICRILDNKAMHRTSRSALRTTRRPRGAAAPSGMWSEEATWDQGGHDGKSGRRRGTTVPVTSSLF